MVLPPDSQNEEQSSTPASPGVPTLVECALEGLSMAIVVADVAGTIRYLNRRAAALVGLPWEQCLGRPLGEWQAALRAALPAVPEEGSPEAEGVRGDNHGSGGIRVCSAEFPHRVFEWRSVPLESDSPETGGTLETVEEITSAVRREAAVRRNELRHTREMEALQARVDLAESFKTELTHNVTHDLRTPLASIKAAVSGLLAGDVSYDRATLSETLTVIEEETDRLQRRVSNLLSMAKMESGGETLHRDWLDPVDVVVSALESFRSLQGDREIRRDFAADLPLIQADYDQLSIAIRNLLENALLYSPAGTPIDVSVRHGLGQVLFRVRDYGTGLMPDEFERVFDKFYRGRSARRIPGTGLGLPICRGIAEAHGGRLWAEHVPGGGVAFVLSIPAPDSDQDVVQLG